jgi:hypothetical protein
VLKTIALRSHLRNRNRPAIPEFFWLESKHVDEFSKRDTSELIARHTFTTEPQKTSRISHFLGRPYILFQGLQERQLRFLTAYY